MKHLLSKVKRGFIHAVFGMIFGDEGKGKAILDLILKNQYNVNARWQGGPNAGHSLSFGNGKTFVAHLLPSGCVLDGIILLMGNDMVIEPARLKKEIEDVEKLGNFKVTDRLYISRIASLITPYHRVFDRANEWMAANKIGTTGTGIGPAYGDKYLRKAIRMGQIINTEKFERLFAELIHFQQSVLKAYITLGFEISGSEEEKLSDELSEWKKAIEWIREHLSIVDMQEKVEELLADGNKILAEGAQGIMLDINEGDYPFVTSSMTGPAGLFAGLSCGPLDVTKYYGVMKPYNTKVGGGDFPSRMIKYHEDLFQEEGKEFGATTGRKRMCGYPDMVIMRHVITMFARYGKLHIILTKCDCYPQELANEDMSVVTHWLYAGDSKPTNILRYPLGDVIDTVQEKTHSWQAPVGTKTGNGGLKICMFINLVKNQLLDIDDLYMIEMIGTGPKMGQYCEYLE